ncbi:MAG TPA: MFS transporter, partial [Acidothermaceae bacterium]
TVYLPALGLQVGMSAGVVGALLAIRSGASMLSRFFVGALAVRLGRRRLLLASVLGASITMFALVFPAPAVAIAVVVGAAGFALGLAQPLAMAWLAEVSPPGLRGTAMSLRLAGNRLGQTAGPALLVVAGGGREYPDATLAFGLALAISGGLFLSTLAIRGRQRGDAAATSTSPHASIGSILRLPGIPRAVIASSVTLSAVDILTVYLPALGLQVGMSAGVVGALLAIRSGASMLSRFFVGALAVRLGRRRLLLASVLGASITMFALVLPAPAVAIAVMVGAAGFALGLAQPLAMAWLAEVSPLGMRGTAMSLRLAGNRLGQTVVPMSIGFVAAATGVAGVVAVTGAVLVAAGIAVRGATDG